MVRLAAKGSPVWQDGTGSCDVIVGREDARERVSRVLDEESDVQEPSSSAGGWGEGRYEQMFCSVRSWH
jgi:hypothetical protein